MLFENLKNVPGLKPIMTKGAIYMLLGVELEKFKDMKSATEFMRKLAEEESVFCFPSECFNFPGFLRVVLSTSEEIINEISKRIIEFASRHYKK